MAKCGIEKYDELPAQVALIDVDAARHALKKIDEGSKWHSIMGRGIPFNLIRSREQIKQSIIDDLENARQIHNGEAEPFWSKYKEKLPV